MRPVPVYLAGTLLGSDIVRIRFLHTAYAERLRFQLVDDKEGTLPYHSWIVSKVISRGILPPVTGKHMSSLIRICVASPLPIMRYV